jgi:peptidoglycan/LPS O-acetylase OafA/YrhL
MNHQIQRLFFFNDDKQEHVRALDGLRGIAVIMVLLSHASNNEMYFYRTIAFNGIGKGGVYLFFVLSAYLLDRQIASALINHKADSFFWRRYFIRRFLRIYPLFFVSLLVFWAASQMGIAETVIHGIDVIKHIFLVEGFGVFWSIPVEFKYYLISPVILLLCHRYLKWEIRRILIFFLLLSAGMLAIDVLFHLDKISTFKYLIVFLTGTFIALFTIIKTGQASIAGKGKAIGIFGFIALTLCFVLNPNYVGDWMGIDTSNNGRKVLVLYALLCGIMLFSALYGKGFFIRLLEFKFLRFIGVISFSMYLFHMPVIYFMRQDILAIPAPLKIYFFFSVTILLSTITFLTIERPLSQVRITRHE